jgi:putative ABC transport system permease protein
MSMTSFSFLRQIAQDVRHQKLRTLLTLLGITWGTVSVALLAAFGEGLQKRLMRNAHGLGEGIVISWPARTSLPFEGLGKGRGLRVTEEDIEALRREIPEARFTGEYGRGNSVVRHERVRLTPQVTAASPVYALMRNLIPSAGGRYVDDLDVDRRRRVVFLGDKLKRELFGEAEAIGQQVMIDNVPFMVVGVLQQKAQDSRYNGSDEDSAFLPGSTYRALFGSRVVDNFVAQARDATQTEAVKTRIYEVLGRRLKFDPKDKEALAMWDTTEGEKMLRTISLGLRLFLGIIGSFTLIVGGIGVSNIMYVVIEERTREIGIKLAVGAKPRYVLGQFLIETLTLTALGGALGFLLTLGVIALYPRPLDKFIGTPEASPSVIVTTTALLGLIGLVAGYFPARRAATLDPVVALKLS